MHVVTSPNPPAVRPSGLAVHMIPLASDNLGWLLVKDGRAALVDGPTAGPVLDYCERLGVTLTTLIHTHTHGDHIGVGLDLKKRGLLDGMRVIGPKAVAEKVPGLSEPVAPGDHFEFEGVRFEAIDTEGHLEGHTAYLADGMVFTGDALFTGGCGYVFTGRYDLMWAGLQRLRELPGETAVYCAHEYTQDNLRFARLLEPHSEALAARVAETEALRAAGRSAVPSTIALERETNPFLRPESEALRGNVARLWAEHQGETIDTEAAGELEIFQWVRELKNMRIV